MTTTNSNANYEAFLGKRNTLISMIDRQITLSASLNIDTWVETLHRLKNRVSNESFKVLIIGEFKRGKSTFINAMLGQDILPAYSTPCTAIINEVKWGQSPQALLHYLKHEDGSQKEPKEIPVEAIEEYVVIPEEPDESYVNPYEKVEILYPLELCRSGVEVIDSPGLNEHATRSQVTEDYLPTVDAIVFVFTCEALASQSEIRFIENNLRPLGHDDLFFVCNKFDQIKDKEKERVRKFAFGKLASLTSQGENGVFFISASNALDGRLNGDDERLEKSGVLILERELEKFLTNDRGRLKILEPAKDLQEAIKVAKQTVPERKAMLQTSREELEIRYQAAQEPLRLLELRRKQIETRISQFSEDLEKVVYDKAKMFFSELPKKIKEWLKDYELKSEIDLKKIDPLNLDQSIKSQVKPIVFELSNYLGTMVEDAFIAWQPKEIQPFVSSRLETLKQDIDARASEFILQVDVLKSQLSSGSSTPFIKESVSSLEKLLCSAGVPANGSFGWTKAIFGFGSKKVMGTVLNTVLLAIVATSIAFVAGSFIATPIIAFAGPILVATGLKIGEVDRANKKIAKQIQFEVEKKFSEQLVAVSDEQAKGFSVSILKHLNDTKYLVDQGLEKEIQNVRDQVESVLKEKKQGQAYVDQRVRDLLILTDNLNKLEGEVDDLISQLSLL